ncbi:MAG: exosortase/archaeosortase family protein [Desulfobulbaceae bacterium]|nr:exosortase/archaeosortase family protein [Desulfobulbaceae bacterium]
MKIALRWLLLIQLVTFWPVWGWYLNRISDRSDEPWGLLALLTALVFLFSRNKNGEIRTHHLALSAGCTAFYLITFQHMVPLGRAGLAIASMALILSPAQLGRSMHLGVFALLLLSLPIIATMQFYLGYPVRLVTAHLVAWLLNLFSFPVSAQGTGLHLAAEVVCVDAPCSGIRMLWSGLYLNFTLACFADLSSFRTWLTYIFAMPVIFIGNVLRAFSLFFIEARIITAPQWAHNGIGLIVFALTSMTIMYFCNKMRTGSKPHPIPPNLHDHSDIKKEALS